uniref:Pyr_redox_2 domain-containing protein n=2 Tax=Caenorhabditis japonica TaxID=281687 RepID=A0A8R1HX25_CAEJA
MEHHDFLSIYWPIFAILALFSQLLVVYTILRHSPQNLQTLKRVLLKTCFFQTIAVIDSFLLQMRQVSHVTPMELWCYGPVRYLEAYIGYCLFHLLQTSALMSITSIFLTLYLKYEAANYLNPSKIRIVIVTVLMFLPAMLSIVFESLLVKNQALPLESREMFRKLNRDVSEHSVIGFMKYTSIPSKGNLYVISLTIISIPIIGLVLRSFQGLTVQVMMPTICYFPSFVCFMFVMITRSAVLASELAYSIRRNYENVKIHQVFEEKHVAQEILPALLAKKSTEAIEKSGVQVKAEKQVKGVRKCCKNVVLQLSDGIELISDLIVVATGEEPNSETIETD